MTRQVVDRIGVARPEHDAAHGAGVWSQVGPKNDVSDTADSSGQPSPWSQGSYTWAIPARWRKTGDKTSGTLFSAKSNEVVTITGADGTTIVTKLGATSASRKPRTTRVEPRDPSRIV